MFNKLRFKNFKRILQLLPKPQKELKGDTTFKSIMTQEAANHTSLPFNADAMHALQAATEQELTKIV